MSQSPLSTAETKCCPRCQAPFDCSAGNIPQCQCVGIRLTADDRTFVAANYTGCLCRACLLAITTSSRLPA